MIQNKIKEIVYPVLKIKPSFLIIGTQKAGTTSLARYLQEHKKIFFNPSSWKEFHYFNNRKNYEKGMGWYLSHFPYKYKKADLLSFEATPEYLYYDFIPKRIKEDLGEIKLIAILRNPAERAYSAWKMYNSFTDNPNAHLRNIYDKRTFADAIYQELNSNNENSLEPYHYIDRGKYFFQIERYLKFFSTSNILILDFNDLKQNLDTLLNDVCDFLEIDRFTPQEIEIFKNKKYNTGKTKKLFSDNAETLKLLQEYFVPFNEKLYNLVERDFMW